MTEKSSERSGVDRTAKPDTPHSGQQVGSGTGRFTGWKKTMFRKSKTMIIVLAVVAVSFLVAGCSDDDHSNPLAPGSMGSGSMLRVVHASPDAPAVDIYEIHKS